MRRTIIALALLASTTSLAATKKAEEAGYLIQSNLTYQTSEGVVETAREFILPESNKGWTALTAPKSGVVLLGKLAKADLKTIHMEYMLVDTRNDSSVVSTPAIIARLGEEAKVTVEGDKDKVAISLTAKRTKFRSQP